MLAVSARECKWTSPWPRSLAEVRRRAPSPCTSWPLARLARSAGSLVRGSGAGHEEEVGEIGRHALLTGVRLEHHDVAVATDHRHGGSGHQAGVRDVHERVVVELQLLGDASDGG